jgi:trans-aconitate 2-methyltransferase
MSGDELGSADRDGWSPEQYDRFAAERAQPFWDLVALVDSDGRFGRCVDLGCGPGDLTLAVTRRLEIDEMVGIDTSDAMLERARTLVGAVDDRLRFARGDIARWTSRADHDLVLANASLHWVPDHATVLARWWDGLAPGGQLAVQVPANADHVAHTVATQVAATEPFLSAMNGLPPPDPVAVNVLTPAEYAVLLDEFGAVDQHVRLQVYPHRLDSSASVVEWMKGTLLTRFARILPAGLYDGLIDAYRARLLATIGDQSPYFYPFNRILMWARKPARR